MSLPIPIHPCWKEVARLIEDVAFARGVSPEEAGEQLVSLARGLASTLKLAKTRPAIVETVGVEVA